MSRHLVERAQRGDRDAYEQLARGVARPLFLVASRVLRDTDSAEDAVQQTLVAIWRDLGNLRDPDRFDAWAYRTLIHYCQSERRRARRRGHLVDLSDSIPDRASDLDAVANRDELGRAFDALSHDHRVVVVLHHLMGVPLTEIAEILDVPYGTVGSRLHHAMQAMRASLDAAARSTIPGGQPA